MSALNSLGAKALLLSFIVTPISARPSARQAVVVPDFTTSESGNPFIEGWYADPDTEYYSDEYWVFPTWSDVYEKQTHFDAFSSPDLVHWTKHENILTNASVTWAHKAMWAPAAIERNGKYYFYFGANDILIPEIEDGLIGGIGVAIADKPEGPYEDALGEPLIGDFYNGAQPIDQDVFIDDDGQAYIYYGGHEHCNVAKLNEDMISLGTFDDGETFKEITPENYVEGAQMTKINGTYYFFWSEGGWTGPDYSVSYAMADNPLGPFKRLANILKQDSAVARGSGHNGVIHVPGTDIYYLTYHRRPLSETDGNHRESCYERMYFNQDGTIREIEMLVKDNFADGNLNGWNATGSGVWAVEGEKMKGVSHAELSLNLLDTNFTDVKMDLKVSALDFSNGDAPYVVFRASDIKGGDYYWARLKGHKVEVGATIGGEQTVLGEGAGSFAGDTEYSVRVTAVGSSIEVFVDDMQEAIVSVEDEGLSIGANGVAAEGTATFDDVSVGRP